MSLALLLLISLPASAAFTMSEAEKQSRIAQEAAALAEGELPPCEGHDRVDDVVSRFEPPSTCPKARELFHFALEESRKVRENCRENARWLEDLYQAPGSCDTQPKRIAVYYRVEKFRSNVLQPEDKFPENIEKIVAEPGLGVDREGILEKKWAGTGEFAHLECRQGASLALTLLRWQTALNKKHYGFANYQTSEFCDNPATGGKDYLELIRYGWKENL